MTIKKHKVGILTTHDEINYGAFLQAYALQKAISGLGYECLIINYKGFKHWILEYWYVLRAVNPIYFIRKLFKVFAFRRDQSKASLTSFSFSKKSINRYGFETIVLGSDEIWNFKNCIGEVFIPAHYGIGVTAKKIISYAPSFGSIGKNEQIPNDIKNSLNGLDAISVRDLNSKIIIDQIADKKAEIVVDPTLLIDFTGDEVKPAISRYILVYIAGKIPDDLIKQTIEFSRKNNLKLISVGYRNKWCNSNCIAVSPFEWIGYVKNADYVLTNMFHGTIFSVKYRRSLCIVLSEYRMNKLGYLVNEILGINDFVFSKDRTLETIFSGRPNYSEVETRLSQKRESSLQYLKTAIDG